MPISSASTQVDSDEYIRKRRAERRAERIKKRHQAAQQVSTITGLPPALAEIKGLRELPPPIGAGIYFLYKGEDVVYVGQSLNPTVRVFAHRLWKDFDRVFVLECAVVALDWLESFYIHKLRPPGNHSRANGEMRAPMSIQEMYP